MQRKKFVNALIITALSLTACTDGQTTDIQTQSAEADGRKQIETTIAPRFLGHLAANGLILKSCEYLGDITEADFDELITHWIDGDSYFAADLQVRDSTISFDVRKLKNIVKAGGRMTEDEWREHARGVITRGLLEYPDPITVKAQLFWNYKGLDFSTIGALSQREDGRFKVVWDNIVSNILIPGRTVRGERREERGPSGSPQTRSSASLSKVIPFEREFNDDEDGWLAAKVEYEITLTGAYYRDTAIKAISGQDFWYDSNVYHQFWSADCQVYLVSRNDWLAEYDYAWAVSNSTLDPVSITYYGPHQPFGIIGAYVGDMCDTGTLFLDSSLLE